MRIAAWTLAISFIIASQVQAAPPYEPLQSLRAGDLLPASRLNSKLYRIYDEVQNNGLVNQYKVHSEFGEFTATTTVGLIKLLHEIEALEEIRTLTNTASYQNALQESGVDVVSGLKQLALNPYGTLRGAGHGVATLFYRAEESMFGSGPSETEDSRTRQLIGFSKSKREIAKRFGVDAYSTNLVLQEKLNELAWADYAGGMTMSAVTLPLGGAAQVVYSTSSTIQLLNDSIATQPPSELKRQNRKKLEAIGLDANLIDLFIDNPHFSPRQQTYITAAVDKLGEVENREIMLLVAIQVADAEMALVITTLSMMYAGYGTRVGAIDELFPVVRVVGGSRDGKNLLVVPADYVTWSASIDSVINAMEEKSGISGGELWILGEASDTALTALKQRGWEVNQRSYGAIGVNEVGLIDQPEESN